jgi:tetratricopeptide (TPR) repeat protein
MIPIHPTILRTPRFCRVVKRQFGVRIVALASLWASLIGKAQEPTVLPAVVPPAPLFPDLSTPPESLAEVKAAIGFTEDEKKVLETLTEKSTGELIEFLRIYERMGNIAMMQAVARIVQQRVPDQADALRMLQSMNQKPEIRKPGYLEEVTSRLLAGEKTTDPEAVDAQANSLIAQKQMGEAAFILERLRELNFPGVKFPFLDSLAACYFDLKRWDDAEKAFAELIRDVTYPDEMRQKADIQYEQVKIEKKIEATRKEVSNDPKKADQRSAELMTEHPRNPSVIEFRVDCLRYAGRDKDALALIENLRASWSGAAVFPYQRLLAHAQLQSRKLDAAAESFSAVVENPAFDETARLDAKKGISTTSIVRKGELAVAAADRGETDNATTLLSTLESEHANDIETTGYKAAKMARLGGGAEALDILLEKQKGWPKNQPFPLQDTLGDVHLERKEYEEARAAYQVILDDSRYDWDHRRRALDGLMNVHKTEVIDSAYTALRDRRLQRARHIRDQFKAEFGDATPEGKILDAEILFGEQKIKKAGDEFQRLEGETPPDKLFAAKSSLGSTYLRSGEWQKAIDTYSDLLDRAPAFTPYERMRARWDRRLAIPLVDPTARVITNYRTEQQGSVLGLGASYDSPWWDGWRLGAFTQNDIIYLDDPVFTPTLGSRSERSEGGVRIQRRFGPNLAAEIIAGVSKSDPLYGARFGRFLNPGLAWAVSFMGNARAMDSIPLQAANGRENQLEFQFGTPLAGPWNINVRSYAKWVSVDNISLAQGYGVDASLDYVWKTETEKRPEIDIGYLGSFQRLEYASDRNETTRALIDPNTNRHGIQLTLRKNLTDKLRLTAQAGTYYSFDESFVGYVVGVGTQYYISDDAFLFAEMRYDSDSRGADSQSGIFEANVGASISF